MNKHLRKDQIFKTETNKSNINFNNFNNETNKLNINFNNKSCSQGHTPTQPLMLKRRNKRGPCYPATPHQNIYSERRKYTSIQRFVYKCAWQLYL